MSYDIEKAKLGGEPLITCALIMDFCALTAGVGPCTATETGDAKCYNTRASCNDPANYDKTTKEYMFCQPRSSLPEGVNMLPFIKGGVQKASTSITGGAGLGKRAVVTLNMFDGPHHDRGIDPYWEERTYNAQEQGTFWGKFIARNPFYEGRTLKIGYGYIGSPFSTSDFEYQEYDIIDIKGPTKGSVSIVGKDILVRTYERKSLYPPANTGKLLNDIATSAGTATLTPTGIGDSEYPASGTLSIGKEAKTFTRSGDTLTLTSHGQWGTTDKEHDEGDTVQVCATWNADPDTDNIIDVLDELLVTGAGLPSSYIPTSDWETERDLWLVASNVKGILMKPESIEKVIGELSECFMFDIWWNAVSQTVNLKALSPEPAGVAVNVLTENSDIKQGSLKVDRVSKERYTEIQVWYGKDDYSEKNEVEHFGKIRISADPDRSGPDQYDGDSIKTILCRWFDLDGNASQLSGRYLSRYSDTPEIVTFTLDQKDHGKVEIAERVELNSWQLQDFAGANDPRRFQVLEINEGRDPGCDFTVKALTSSFVGRYFFITIDAMPDYSSASDEQKAANGFISLDSGEFADGTKAYKII